jgi:hypothetical protein
LTGREGWRGCGGRGQGSKLSDRKDRKASGILRGVNKRVRVLCAWESSAEILSVSGEGRLVSLVRASCARDLPPLTRSQEGQRRRIPPFEKRERWGTRPLTSLLFEDSAHQEKDDGKGIPEK